MHPKEVEILISQQQDINNKLKTLRMTIEKRKSINLLQEITSAMVHYIKFHYGFGVAIPAHWAGVTLYILVAFKSRNKTN